MGKRELPNTRKARKGKNLRDHYYPSVFGLNT